MCDAFFFLCTIVFVFSLLRCFLWGQFTEFRLFPAHLHHFLCSYFFYFLYKSTHYIKLSCFAYTGWKNICVKFMYSLKPHCFYQQILNCKVVSTYIFNGGYFSNCQALKTNGNTCRARSRSQFLSWKHNMFLLPAVAIIRGWTSLWKDCWNLK